MLERWKNEHHQARHLCYAYCFGVDKAEYRANDDGEPNNSAGAPILGQIHSFELTNVLIGVVRYYGGTKLGVGGLINAYRTAAKEAIESGTIIIRELRQFLQLTFNYEDMPHVMNSVKQPFVEIIHQDFGFHCEIKVNVALENLVPLLDQLQAFSSLKSIDLGIK